MSSPGKAVSDIPELLEMILLQTDQKTVIRAQRVSKTFHATIAGSVTLQRTLWRSPKKHVLGAPRVRYNLNPLISDRKRRLGIKELIQWEMDKKKQLHVDLIFYSLPAVGNLPYGSWCNMLVAQPEPGWELVVTMGYYLPPWVGRRGIDDDRLRKFSIRYIGGWPPTLGQVRYTVLEKLATPDFRVVKAHGGKKEGAYYEVER